MLKMSRSFRRLAWLALACSLSLILLLVAGYTSTQAEDPDFSTINDPLNGDFEFTNVSDLLIRRPNSPLSETKTDINIYLLETDNEAISSQSKVNISTVDCGAFPGYYQSTVVGRFFNLPYDVIVTLAPNSEASGQGCTTAAGTPNLILTVRDLAGTEGASTELSSTATPPIAAGDFDLDGFDDLLILGEKELVAATAADISDMSQGLVLGSPTALTTKNDLVSSPAIGDFNSDGIKDIAWVNGFSKVAFASVCPGSVDGTICDGMAALDVLYSPQESGATDIDVHGCAYGSSPGLAAGSFSTTYEGDGLVGLNCPGGYNLKADWYQFNEDWSIIGSGPLQELALLQAPFPLGDTHAAAARLSFDVDLDQVVFATSDPEGDKSCNPPFVQPQNYVRMIEKVGVIAFDNDQMTVQITKGNTGNCVNYDGFRFFSIPFVNGMAVARFADIADDASSSAEFDLHIATLLNDGVVRIYSVDAPTSYEPVIVSNNSIRSSLDLNEIDINFGELNAQGWLVAGDLQGRSVLVGPPEVLRVTGHSQPSVILGAPPMHVDYILPDESTSTEWGVINFTATPYEYNSSYSMTDTGTSQSSNTDKTSYTYATTVKTGESVSLKIPVVSIKGSIKTATTNKAEQVAETYTYTQDEFKYDASTSTGLGDEIWYDVSTFNVYNYPVIGETICPAANPNCSTEEEGQLYVSFSGPNSSGAGPGPGATTEWYQPVQEPGNIFSYPWTQSQIGDLVAQGIDPLTDPQTFFTDDSDQKQELNWSGTTTTAQTAGTTNTHSYEKSYSLSVGIKFSSDDSSAGGGFSDSVNYNESDAVSTLSSSTSSLGASEGVTISKPNTFLDTSIYDYKVGPTIFGRSETPGTADVVTLPEDIQTSGPLQAAFTADPLDPDAGSWWASSESPYQQYVDVALNHPVRWQVVDGSGGLNCLTYNDGLAYYCLDINDPEPNDLWNSNYYWMRGLLISVEGQDGTQRTQANVGDVVWLHARVYNYSFLDMDADSKIQVRFYRQEMQGTAPTGDSVLISSLTLDPLPGFNSAASPDVENWTTAITSWTPEESLGDTYQIFWVLVWVEDGSGNLVSELPGHGLSMLPGDLTSIGDVPLEYVTLDDESKTFSNNVGYLHTKFYIAADDTTPESHLFSASDTLHLAVENASVTPQQALPYQKVIIGADIVSEDAPSEAVHVQIYPDAAAWRAYKDDPSLQPPRPLDVEMLPYIRPGESDRLEVPYQATACGTHEVAIVAKAAGMEEAVVGTAEFTIPCYAYLPVFPDQ